MQMIDYDNEFDHKGMGIDFGAGFARMNNRDDQSLRGLDFGTNIFDQKQAIDNLLFAPLNHQQDKEGFAPNSTDWENQHRSLKPTMPDHSTVSHPSTNQAP